LLPIDLAPGLGCEEGPARAVGGEGDRQPGAAKDFAEGHHDGDGGLAGPELRVEQALGGIVDHRDQRLALVGIPDEPAMGAAVDREQLAVAGPWLAAPAMPSARPPPGDEP